MKSLRKLAIVIHQLNPWGGHDRSTLEIARRLKSELPLEIYSFTLEDPAHDDSIKTWDHHKIWPHPRKPAILMQTWFYVASWVVLKLIPKISGNRRPFIHATGACSLVSDVVQVQFVQSAWKSKLHEMSALDHSKGAHPTASLGGIFRRLYHRILLEYNICIEKSVYTPEKTYIAIADCVALELQKYFNIPRSKIKIIWHGVDSETFRLARGDEKKTLRIKYSIKEQETVALLVGEYARKGLAASIRALALLSPEARSNLRLVAVGGGDHDGFLALAKSLNVHDHVTLLGHQKGIELIYRVADIFLLPTLYEPFGLVILEAMASGLAPIVSRLAGGSELITEGVNGLLLSNPSDEAEIAKALEALVLNPSMRAQIAAGARQVAEKRGWKKVADEYAQLLAPLMNQDSGQKSAPPA